LACPAHLAKEAQPIANSDPVGKGARSKGLPCLRLWSTPDLALREESFRALDGCGKIVRKARQEFFAIRLALPWCSIHANRCKSFGMRTYEKRARKCRGMRTYKFIGLKVF